MIEGGIPPLVSGIIIFLDPGRFFEEAIASVIAQTYASWELLLVDDGSNDGSSDLARRYAERYPGRVRYLAHPGHTNRGMSASRNLGIRHARGVYVAFLDADDVWLPNKLAEQVPLLEQHPEAAMLYGRTQYWFSWSADAPAEDSLTPPPPALDRLVAPPMLLAAFLEDEGVYPCTCSVLVRRAVFDEIGMFEERFRDANEDMAFYAKVFLQAPVYVASACWDRYRIHPDSFWGRMRAQGLLQDDADALRPDRLAYLEWVQAYLDTRGFDVPEVRAALDAALWPYRHPSLHGLKRRLGPPLDRARRGVHRAGGYVLPASVRRRLRRRFTRRS